MLLLPAHYCLKRTCLCTCFATAHIATQNIHTNYSVQSIRNLLLLRRPCIPQTVTCPQSASNAEAKARKARTPPPPREKEVPPHGVGRPPSLVCEQTLQALLQGVNTCGDTMLLLQYFAVENIILGLLFWLSALGSE